MPTAALARGALAQPSSRLNPPPEQFPFFLRDPRDVAERHRLQDDHSLGDAERGIETIPGDAVQAGAYDVAVECTGNHLGFGVALRAVRPRGTLVMKSTYADTLTFNASIDHAQRPGTMKVLFEITPSTGMK